MSPIAAFLTEATCGEACWHAREDICRCSCAGKNHGCLRSANGEQPIRTARIDSFRYELRAIGIGTDTNVWKQAKQINTDAGPRSVQRVTDTLTYTYRWETTDKGAPARIKRATESQITHWPELTAAREQIAEIKSKPFTWIEIEHAWPNLLWVKIS